jgi:paraquat-inducible protein B
MSKKASATMVGAFMIAGIALAIGLIVALGGGRLFHDRSRAIVYFDGSVSGLRIGAPVKFRGIDIGTVHDIRINMSGAMQDPKHVRIPVVIEIDEKKLSAEGVTIDVEDPATARALIDRGLRAQLQSESLITGLRFVALDFKPGTPVNLEGGPDSQYPEIPSVPSPFAQIHDRVHTVIDHLEEIDLRRIATAIEAAAKDTHELISSPHLRRTVANLDELTRNLNRNAVALDATTRAIGSAADEWRQAAHAARSIASPDGLLSTQLGATLAELEAAARSLRRLSDRLNRDPGVIVRGGAQ